MHKKSMIRSGGLRVGEYCFRLVDSEEGGRMFEADQNEMGQTLGKV